MTKPLLRLRGCGKRKDQVWSSGESLRIGRDATCDVRFPEDAISRRHAEFVHTDRGWVLRDLGSTNGTLVNGVRLSRIDHRLCLNDLVQCGAVVFVVEELVQGAAAPPVPAAREQNFQVMHVARQSCREAVQSLAMDVTQRLPGSERLLSLLQIGEHLHKIDALDELLDASLLDICQILQSQRGAFLLSDRANGNLHLRSVVPGRVESAPRGAYSNTLAKRCFDKGESVICEDIANDSDLMRAQSIGDGSMGSVICALLRSPRQKLGVLHLSRGILQEPFTREDLRIADALAVTISSGIEAGQTLVERQQGVFVQTVTALAQAIDCRDHYTGGHTQRVTDYALLLAQEMRLPPREIHTVQIGTPLHDIGKIGIDDAVLRKPGKLTPAEFEHIKTHPLKGVAILESIPQLAAVLPIVRNHHERWDGRGYPDSLAGQDIPMLARVVTVADVFDALTSERSYRGALSAEAAFVFIQKHSGIQFDPHCVEHFLRLRARLMQMLESRDAHPVTVPRSLLDKLVQEARPFTSV
jgi:HD-GYP domain-containing protein (c-di-GMP phosphodiesterase class II)